MNIIQLTKNRINTLIKHNVTVATTTKILLISLVIALFMSISSFLLIQQFQTETILDNIKQLSATVESTASIASFTNDEVLAKELANGLLKNSTVNRVKLYNGNKLLVNVGNNNENGEYAKEYRKALFSPFDHTENIGSLVITINQKAIIDGAITYASIVSLVLFIIIIIFAITLAYAININIINPIRVIANNLHLMSRSQLQSIKKPQQHEHDEIGRLVDDLNTLTARQTKLIEAEKTLRISQQQAQRRIHLIFEKNKNGLFIADYHLNLNVWNSALESLLSTKINLHDNLVNILHKQKTDLNALIKKAIETQQTASLILNIAKPQEVQYWIELSIQPLDQDNLQGVMIDISSHKQLEMAALDIAERDPLTQALNRRGFENKFNDCLKRTKPGNASALLLIDLDGFKYINDHYGHPAGDHILINVTERLSAMTRRSDLMARLGGDEFVVLITDIKQLQDIFNLASKIIQSLSQPILFESHKLRVGASVGIATTNSAEHAIHSLLKLADEAMYEAKKAGKGQFVLSRDTIIT